MARLVRSVLRLLGAGQPAPHYPTLSRRAAALEVRLPRLSRGPLHLAVDSTGLKLYGDGEWKVRLHGKEKSRTWRKLHLLIDHATHEAVACSVSGQYVLDRKALPGLLKRVEGETAEVLGDSVYDFRDCYRATDGVGARAVIPPQVRARSGAVTSSETGTRQYCGGGRSDATSGRRRPVITGAHLSRRR